MNWNAASTEEFFSTVPVQSERTFLENNLAINIKNLKIQSIPSVQVISILIIYHKKITTGMIKDSFKMLFIITLFIMEN